MRKSAWIMLVALCAGVLVLGCSEKRVNEFEEAQARFAEDPTALDGVFKGEIVLCRRVGAKSAKRIGVSDEFEAGENNKVFAFVDFDNAELGRLYTVHMVWLRPDDHEIFRKYAEVRVDKAETGYRSTIHWKSNLDLHYLKEEFQESERPAFTLDSSMGTYVKGVPRESGTYKLRVYLYRDLMLEKSFTLTGSSRQPEEEVPGDPS